MIGQTAELMVTAFNQHSILCSFSVEVFTLQGQEELLCEFVSDIQVVQNHFLIDVSDDFLQVTGEFLSLLPVQ